MTIAMQLSGAFEEDAIRSTRKRPKKKQGQQTQSGRDASQAREEAEPERSEDKTGGDNRPGLGLNSVPEAPETKDDDDGAVVLAKPTTSAISTPEEPRWQPPRKSAPDRPLYDSIEPPSLLRESDDEDDGDVSRLEHSHRPLTVAPLPSDFSYSYDKESDAYSERDAGGVGDEGAQGTINSDSDDMFMTEDSIMHRFGEDKAISLVASVANKHKLDDRQTSGNQQKPPPTKRTKLDLDTTSAHTRTSPSRVTLETARSSSLSTECTAPMLEPKPIPIVKALFFNATLPTDAGPWTQNNTFPVPESAHCEAKPLGGSTHIAASTGPTVDPLGPKIAASGGQKDSTVNPASAHSPETHHHDQQQQRQQQQTQLQDYILLGQGGGDEATTSRSLETLQGEEWLNDIVLDSAMRLVELVRPSHIYHINPAALRPGCRGLPWRKLLGMDLQKIIDSAGNLLEDNERQQQQRGVEMVLIPRNAGKCHWVLFVAFPQQQRIDLYDPLPVADHSTILSPLRTAPNTTAPELPGLRDWGTWPVTARSCPRQSDTHSCGVFVVVFALYLCVNRPLPAQLDGVLWRRLISDLCHDLQDWDQYDPHQDDRPDGGSDPAYAHECDKRLAEIQQVTQGITARAPSPSSHPATFSRSMTSYSARVHESVEMLKQRETDLYRSISTTVNYAVDAHQVLQGLANALGDTVTKGRLFEQRLNEAISQRQMTLQTVRVWQNETPGTAEAVFTTVGNDIKALQESLMSIRPVGKHSSAEMDVGGVTRANLASLCTAAQLRFTRASNFARHTAHCYRIWLKEHATLEEPK